jgi:hypothetical protein
MKRIQASHKVLANFLSNTAFKTQHKETKSSFDSVSLTFKELS